MIASSIVKKAGKETLGIFKNTRDILDILKCFPKIMKNFILCIFFYLMDCIKYFIVAIVALMTYILLRKGSFDNHLNKMLAQVEKYVGWPNDIKNMCYRCKNRKGKDGGLVESLKNIFNFKTKQKGDSPINFFLFTLVLCILYLFGYFFSQVKYNSKTNA